MQFQIPQFIDTESKIVGPLTLTQFLYLAGAAGFSFVLYFVLQFWLWIMLTAIFTAIGVSLAFIRYNGQPLAKILWFAINFFWRPKLYLWQREKIEKTIIITQTGAGTKLIEDKRKQIQDLFSKTSGIKKLWQDLMTTKNPIKREMIYYWGKKPAETIQAIRKITGEKEFVKRIDYR
jgi:hypothetical protein